MHAEDKCQGQEELLSQKAKVPGSAPFLSLGPECVLYHHAMLPCSPELYGKRVSEAFLTKPGERAEGNCETEALAIRLRDIQL